MNPRKETHTSSNGKLVFGVASFIFSIICLIFCLVFMILAVKLFLEANLLDALFAILGAMGVWHFGYFGLMLADKTFSS
ncbi:hypothetical protein [Paenibacillus sp. YN15]|uniref:hypothetical protein n=1 Tax=Paenibacillus sp. YN15 TaxID=1742774 RepID=UPI000DCE164B|nr:hypothetical protein [Paenibacillus sp. YN15]RAU92490.1 hypothetical protein DQG13_27560 [Paenibacillus sp. YN15]